MGRDEVGDEDGGWRKDSSLYGSLIRFLDSEHRQRLSELNWTDLVCHTKMFELHPKDHAKHYILSREEQKTTNDSGNKVEENGLDNGWENGERKPV